METVDVVVIGAGQAGLATSYYLTQQGRDHIVLEQDSVSESWRSSRWDSFCLVTPNWTVQLPGFPYQGPDLDGFGRSIPLVKKQKKIDRAHDQHQRDRQHDGHLDHHGASLIAQEIFYEH